MNKPKIKTYIEWLCSDNSGGLDEYKKALEKELKVLNKWLQDNDNDGFGNYKKALEEKLEKLKIKDDKVTEKNITNNTEKDNNNETESK